MWNLLIKQQAPMLAQDMSKSIELILDETAERNGIPPFDLHMLFKEQNKESVGLIYQGKQLLRTVQVKDMILEIFDAQMKNLPALLKKQINKMMDGKSADVMITEIMREGSLLAQYDSDDELEYYTIVEEKKEKINLEDFFSSL